MEQIDVERPCLICGSPGQAAIAPVYDQFHTSVRNAIDVVAELRKDNPLSQTVYLQVFADALLVYCEASKNIREHGAIVSHPRIGQPIENPYLKIQTAKGAVLARMSAIKSDRILKLLGL